MLTQAISLSTQLNFVSLNGGSNSKSYVWQVRLFFISFYTKSHFKVSEHGSDLPAPTQRNYPLGLVHIQTSEAQKHLDTECCSRCPGPLCTFVVIGHPHKAGLAHMAPLEWVKETGSGLITGCWVCPAVRHQCVSHSVPSIPHSLFFSFRLSVFPFSRQCKSNTHTHARTPENHESFMQAGCIIPEACSLRPTPTRLHHLEREGKPSLGEREGDWHIEMARWTRRERRIHQERGWR